MFLTKAKGILGMNARNLLYVERYNTRADKRFADDKIYTKNFLTSRGIGSAKIITVIRSYNELKRFRPAVLPGNFVIKPNHGFGGEGIIVITETKGGVFHGVAGEKWNWRDLYRACSAILDGKYAISGLRDEVIIEERLEAHEYFRTLAPTGLPDIRVIVFNLVPVVAMVRIPTMESHGKANLHLGAIGLGLDLGTGKTTYGVQHGHFVTRLPNGDRVNSLMLPDWEQILHTAALCQKVSEIGYLAVDLVITTKGVKVLELNARAGLSVQIANRVFLKSRLEKITDLKVIDPAQGVEIAKTLFAVKRPRVERHINESHIINPYERVRLLNTDQEEIVAKIEPHAETLILADRIVLPHEETTLSFHLRDEKIISPFARATLPPDYGLVIPGKLLKGFLMHMNPTHIQTQESVKHRPTPDEKILVNIDKKIYEIGKQIHFLSRLKPENLTQMRSLFLAHPTSSPQFTYPPVDIDIEGLRKELAKLPREVSHPLAPLFYNKIIELDTRLSLVAVRGTEEIMSHSVSLYGDVTYDDFIFACNWMRAQEIAPDTSRELTMQEIQKMTRSFLTAHRLKHWKIIVQEDAVVDMQVNKSGTLFISAHARMTEHRLTAVLAHEVETHIYRHENGRALPYRIFEQGTSRYLETEEGLAMLNQEQTGVPLGEKRLWAAWRTVAIWHGREMGFVALFHHLKSVYGLSDESAWHTCIKVKRGLTDTDTHAVFTKDRVYFSGYLNVREYYRVHGNDGIRRLYIGKIKIDDIPLLSSIDGIRTKYLPSWCRAPAPTEAVRPE